jgi:predicted alpha/beta hydrolase family esterase
MPSRRVLTLPGLYSSAPGHWQTCWEKLHGFERVEQADWSTPTRHAWLARLEAALAREPEPVVLVAHSLGCALVAHAAERQRAKIAGAFLVAPADVDDPTRTPEATRDFAPLPRKPLGFAACVIASSDDPYIALPRAAQLAEHWHAEFIDAGALGHINAESGLGDWPEGYRWLSALLT